VHSSLPHTPAPDLTEWQTAGRDKVPGCKVAPLAARPGREPPVRHPCCSRTKDLTPSREACTHFRQIKVEGRVDLNNVSEFLAQATYVLKKWHCQDLLVVEAWVYLSLSWSLDLI